MGGPQAQSASRAALAKRAPDVVAVWETLDDSPTGTEAARREIRRRVAAGDAPRLLAEQEAVADALAAALAEIPEEALRAAGGEEDWNVAQAFAHTTAARRFLTAWAAMEATGEWPDVDPPRATPGIPGPADATRELLLTLLAKSRASMARSAAQIAGHELEDCRLEGSPIGRLRCGEWILWVGVHDLMHLDQIERTVARLAAAGDGGPAAVGG
ncbi:MAG TPA: DinB family protein [Candidatus Limnocylindria bacterium]|nr:DinB family protein [Candidatus Limnocylindria bacterium]